MAQQVSVTVQVQETVNALMDLQKKTERYGMNLAADIGAGGRMKAYYDHRYLAMRYRSEGGTSNSRLDLTNIDWAQRKRKPFLFSGRRGRLDRRGRQGMGFSLENRRPSLKVAYFSAFMHNLYERDCYVRGKLRPGTHLFRDTFPQMLQDVVPHAVDRFNAKLDRAIAEAGLR